MKLKKLCVFLFIVVCLFSTNVYASEARPMEHATNCILNDKFENKSPTGSFGSSLKICGVMYTDSLDNERIYEFDNDVEEGIGLLKCKTKTPRRSGIRFPIATKTQGGEYASVMSINGEDRDVYAQDLESLLRLWDNVMYEGFSIANLDIDSKEEGQGIKTRDDIKTIVDGCVTNTPISDESRELYSQDLDRALTPSNSAKGKPSSTDDLLTDIVSEIKETKLPNVTRTEDGEYVTSVWINGEYRKLYAHDLESLLRLWDNFISKKFVIANLSSCVSLADVYKDPCKQIFDINVERLKSCSIRTALILAMHQNLSITSGLNSRQESNLISVFLKAWNDRRNEFISYCSSRLCELREEVLNLLGIQQEECDEQITDRIIYLYLTLQ